MSAVESGLPPLDLFRSRLLGPSRFEDYCFETCDSNLPSPPASSSSTLSVTSSAAATPLLASSLTINPVVLQSSPVFGLQELAAWGVTGRKRSMTPSDLSEEDELVAKRLRAAEPQTRYASFAMGQADYASVDSRTPNTVVYRPTDFEPFSQPRQQSYPGHHTGMQFSSTQHTNTRSFSQGGDPRSQRFAGPSWSPSAMSSLAPASQSPTAFDDWSRETSSGASAYAMSHYSPAYSPTNAFSPNHIRPAEYIVPSDTFSLPQQDDETAQHLLEHRGQPGENPSYLSSLPSIVANITAQQRRQHQLDEGSASGTHSPRPEQRNSSREASNQSYEQSFDQGAESSREKNRCYDHGCNGKVFSTFSNLLRHQREKDGTSSKSACPRCGAEFTRSTARNSHMRQGKCKENFDFHMERDDEPA